MPTSVLIVDDDPGFGRAAAEILADRGYRVLAHVTTAAEALAKCEQLDPDAVLLDVRLPDGDGVTLAETLCAGLDRPRILLVSTDRKAVSPAALSQSGAAASSPRPNSRTATWTTISRRERSTSLTRAAVCEPSPSCLSRRRQGYSPPRPLERLDPIGQADQAGTAGARRGAADAVVANLDGQFAVGRGHADPSSGGDGVFGDVRQSL